MEQLSHQVNLFITFGEIAIMFPKANTLFYIPISSLQGCGSLPEFIIICTFIILTLMDRSDISLWF